MNKKIIFTSFFLGVCVLIEQLLSGAIIKLTGGLGYIFADFIIISVIFGAVSYLANRHEKMKSVISFSILSLIIYAVVCLGFSKTEIGKKNMELLDKNIDNSGQIVYEDSLKEENEEQIEIVVTDGNGVSQIVIYGIYFTISILSGKCAVKKSNRQ